MSDICFIFKKLKIEINGDEVHYIQPPNIDFTDDIHKFELLHCKTGLIGQSIGLVNDEHDIYLHADLGFLNKESKNELIKLKERMTKEGLFRDWSYMAMSYPTGKYKDIRERSIERSRDAMRDAGMTLPVDQFEKKKAVKEATQEMAKGGKRQIIEVIAGERNISLSKGCNVTCMVQDDNDIVTFLSCPDKMFKLIGFAWDGPMYETNTTSSSYSSQNTHETEKRKGGMLGAAVGTAVMPGVGTAIGYAATSKKVNNSQTKGNTGGTICTRDKEIDSIATISLINIETNESFSIGIKCTTELSINLDRFNWPNASTEVAQANSIVDEEKKRIELLKEYKELLDLGVLSQEEFNNKKQELLSDK